MPYKDPEVKRQYMKEYRRQNAGRLAEQKRQWKRDNRSKVNAYNRLWRAENREKVAEYNKTRRRFYGDAYALMAEAAGTIDKLNRILEDVRNEIRS